MAGGRMYALPETFSSTCGYGPGCGSGMGPGSGSVVNGSRPPLRSPRSSPAHSRRRSSRSRPRPRPASRRRRFAARPSPPGSAPRARTEPLLGSDRCLPLPCLLDVPPKGGPQRGPKRLALLVGHRECPVVLILDPDVVLLDGLVPVAVLQVVVGAPDGVLAD